MPSILKIRVIKARNLICDSEINLNPPVSFYSTLKLIENTELLEDYSGSPYSISVQSETGLSSSESESEASRDPKYSEQSYFDYRRRQLGAERATSPTNFTFRTKAVQCSDGCPKWDEDFRLEVTDDAQLQDTPLQLHCYRDAATWLGSLTVDLNPLLARDSPYGICGWFPLDKDESSSSTSSGLRREIFLQAKIQFFGDSNPFKESSAGVQFFCTSEIPTCIKHLAMIGLVEDLLTEHLPADFSPTALPSHFESKLIGQLRRQIGKKVLEMGGSAVLSYQQSIEWEPAAKCVTVRGLGTAVKILQRINQQVYGISPNHEAPFEGHESSTSSSSSSSSSSTSSSSSSSSSEDELNKAALIEETIKELPAKASTIDLVTISEFPSGVIESIGGIVSARAVKMFPAHEKSKHSSHHSQRFYSQMRAIGDFREQWQDEVREEIRAHAKTLACNAVIGYTENVSILDDLYILSASGTAVKAAFSGLLPPTEEEKENSMTAGNAEETENEADDEIVKKVAKQKRNKKKRRAVKKPILKRKSLKLKGPEALKCSACHLPYRRAHAPFTAAFQPCQLCHSRFVPEFLFGTCSVPAELEIIEGIGGLIEAYVCKPLPQGKSSAGNRSVATATAISSALPFIEYDLHRQLLYKLRISGLNAVFGLRYRLAYTAEMIVAVATGTGLFLAALPRPEPIRISRNLKVKDDEDVQMASIQSEIIRRSHDNRDLIEETLLRKHPKLALNMSSSSESDSSDFSSNESTTSSITSSSSDLSSSDDSSSSSSSSSSSDSEIDINDALAVIQIDDDADEDIMAVLLDPKDQTQSSSFSLRDPKYPCKIKHVVEINYIVIETMAHHPNLQMAAIFRELYKKLKRENPNGFLSCIDHQFISDDSSIKVLTSAIIYERDEQIDKADVKTEQDLDIEEDAVLLPESFEDVLVTASSRLPCASLVNDYGRVSFNSSLQSKTATEQIRSLINRAILGLKAFSLAIGGNGLCAVRVDQGPVIISDKHVGSEKRIRISISGDVILYQQ